MAKNSKYCKNCDAPVHGNFCAECGQRTSVDKVTFSETIADFWNYVFSVDAPFLVTIKMLFINPGKLLRDFLSGKRKTYYKPVAFFILMTIIYLLIRSLIDHDPFVNTTLQVSDNSQRQLLTEAREYMLLNIDKLLFVFVFTMGLLLKLFYYKKYSLAEFIAVSFYMIAIYTLLAILNMFFIKYVNPDFQLLAVLIMLFYFCYAMISFFQRKKILVLIKSLLIFVLGFMSYGFIAFAIAVLIVWIQGS